MLAKTDRPEIKTLFNEDSEKRLMTASIKKMSFIL
jgi:hypothetical protein